MVNFSFRPAVRENVGLILGVIGSSGSGKTFSALRLASGLSGGEPFAVIDTESGRALHYADQFDFHHGKLNAPFRPDAYAEAIKAASNYSVVVVDSASHEWAGEGGILDWQEEEHKRMGYKESCKMASWVKPKMSHKAMVQKLLQVNSHIILCFRAEEKIEMVRKNGKTVVQPKSSATGRNGWIPICEKNLPYELTASFLLMADNPGVPIPIKLQEQHKKYVDLSAPLDETAGKGFGEWAKGGATSEPESKPKTNKKVTASDPDLIDEGERQRLYEITTSLGVDTSRVKVILGLYGYESSKEIRKSDYDEICDTLRKEIGSAAS